MRDGGCVLLMYYFGSSMSVNHKLSFGEFFPANSGTPFNPFPKYSEMLF